MESLYEGLRNSVSSRATDIYLYIGIKRAPRTLFYRAVPCLLRACVECSVPLSFDRDGLPAHIGASASFAVNPVVYSVGAVRLGLWEIRERELGC